MSHMFFELTALGVIWLVAWALGAADPRGRGPRIRLVDRWTVTGLAVALCVTYFFAGLHKMNDNFLSLGARSAAVDGIRQFWIYADLGSEPPLWAKAAAAWGTVVIECGAPILAWRSRRLRLPAIFALFAMHYPMVSTMNVSDYPMITSAFYPALFDRAHFRLLWRELRAPTRWHALGVGVGLGLQAWAVPWWGEFTIFGLFVMGLWGYAAVAMLRMCRRPRLLSSAAS
jgi:hypothetical protein